MNSKLSDKARFFLSAIVESSQDSIVTIDFDQIITSWNKASEDLYGYSSEEVVGKPITMLTLPSDFQQLLQNIRDIRHRQRVELFDTVRKHKDGNEVHLEIMLSPVKDDTGQIIGVSTISRDISARKRVEEALLASQERLRITVESATDYAIMTINVKGYYDSWSKGAELIFGYAAEEAVGQYTGLIFTPEDIETGMPEKEMEQARGQGRAEDERWHMHKSGRRLFLSGVMTPIITDTGVLAGYVKLARDMTARKMLEQQKDDFIGITSHELKTPVTSIKSYVELLRESLAKAGDTENVNLAEKLDAQVDRLTNLIHTLLDITRISEGKLTLRKAPFTIDDLVNECIDEVLQLYPGRKLVLKGSRPIVNADRGRIGQVLTNLLSNAVKYSADDTDVAISTETIGNTVKVSVEDHGVGIPNDSRSRIFERFYRVSETAVNTYSGLGLGLFIASQIIKQHGGTIDVASTPGKGSVFYFTLPVADQTGK